VVSGDAPAKVVERAERRARARADKDFALADALRDEIAEAGWTVVDQPDGGFRLQSAEAEADAVLGRVRAADVPSILEDSPTADVSAHWVVEGWPEDVERALAAFRANAGDRRMQYVVADVTGEDPGRWGDDVEVLTLEEGTGWAAARNAGLRRSRGSILVALDGSVEPTGDVLGPLERELRNPDVGVAGPFGVTTTDLREFEAATDPGPCDAIEGYLMAFRREILGDAGPFDEKFTWYRTADIDWSFRVKDAGYRCVVVDVPVRKHEHRMWFETDPAVRAKWSKRNFYRFLDRFRDRWDLVLSGEPPQEPPEG
jgi:cellulose synthase/poly-beta-1,6-N-acetylglucosamine synthase-like glycosyltransferase